MSKDPKNWTIGRTWDWLENPRILKEGAWNYLDSIAADQSSSPDSKVVQKISAVGVDWNFWKSAKSHLQAEHGEEAMAEFFRHFKAQDALRNRGVAIFGEVSMRRSDATFMCYLVGQYERGGENAPSLDEIGPELAEWLHSAIKHRNSQTLIHLAKLLDKKFWPSDVPQFDYLERFPIKGGLDPRKSEKFLILKAFSNCLQKDRRLPTKKRIAELRMVELGNDREFRRNIKDLGFGGLPSE